MPQWRKTKLQLARRVGHGGHSAFYTALHWVGQDLIASEAYEAPGSEEVEVKPSISY
jgi:hypothetical protein